MKKFLALLMAALMAVGCMVGLTACSGDDTAKIGVIYIGDETEGYTLAHMEGIYAAAEKLGIRDLIVERKKVDESENCSTAAKQLIAEGCTLIISNSYGHQDYMYSVASENPDVSFVAMTGDYAAISGLSNFYNAFTDVYEARYVSGVVAGLKLQEMIDNGVLTDDNKNADGAYKIGYVGAYNYAEVVSGYTAFFLGLQSVVSNTVMEVKYTDSWFDYDREAAAAEYLMSQGCCIIGQHADSTGAPSAVEKAYNAYVQKGNDGSKWNCFSVGYNVSMLEAAPHVALTSASNVWEVYYTTLFTAWQNGTDLPQDWSEGLSQNAVCLTDLGTACAAGTADKVAEVEKAIADGTTHVFDCAKFTVNGSHIKSNIVNTSYMNWATMTAIHEGSDIETVKQDGTSYYVSESVDRSAPYFSIRIDGITETKFSAE